MALADNSIKSLFGIRPLLSLEFFPPKNEILAEELLQNAELIATHIKPDFVSITYGAGGTTSKLTYLYTQILRERFGWVVMPHLTCVGHSTDEVLGIAESYHRMGVRNLMALRGDPPKGVKDWTPHPQGLRYASELVSLLQREVPELTLGVAGYPEKHPEAATFDDDLKNLKHKVDQGASFVTTQLFFDSALYGTFVEKCRTSEITQPIIPGLLPALSLEQLQKMGKFCQTALPKELIANMEALPAENQWEAGVDWTVEQIDTLLKAGAPGIHLYIMNRSQSLLRLVQKLHEKGLFKESIKKK